MLTKAVLIKQALAMGLVCTVGVGAGVKFEAPIKRTYHTARAALDGHYRVKPARKPTTSRQADCPSMTSATLPTTPLSVPVRPIDDKTAETALIATGNQPDFTPILPPPVPSDDPDVHFTLPAPSHTPVPEPAIWVTMIGGFAVAGTAIRTKEIKLARRS